jgi:dTDP-glucose 4,6-dehydratase
MSDYQDPMNIGTELERTILDFAKIVIDVTSSKSEIIHLPALIDDPRQRKPDITRARTILGWEPKIGIEEGLKATAEFFQSRIIERK